MLTRPNDNDEDMVRLIEDNAPQSPISWRDLIVTDAEGSKCDLGCFVFDADSSRGLAWTDATPNAGIASWWGYFISAPGEDPDDTTPHIPVNWTGFHEFATNQPATA